MNDSMNEQNYRLLIYRNHFRHSPGSSLQMTTNCIQQKDKEELVANVGLFIDEQQQKQIHVTLRKLSNLSDQCQKHHYRMYFF